jgi:hypothetical protein
MQRFFPRQTWWKPTPSQAAEKRAEATSEALWGVDTTRRHNKSLGSRSIWNLFFRSPFRRGNQGAKRDAALAAVFNFVERSEELFSLRMGGPLKLLLLEWGSYQPLG